MLFKHSSVSIRTRLIDMISLTCFIFFFYLLWIGSYSLFTPDEGRYVEAAREMIATGNYITPHVNGVAFLDKPILYYWLEALGLAIFGINEGAARFFPVLFGWMGCLTTYYCGRELFNRRTGIISALILASSPLYFGSAHYANLDLEIAVLISCSLLFFITAIKCQDKTRIFYFFIAYSFAGFAFLTKGLMSIVFPSMIVGSWIFLLWRWDLIKKIHLIPGLLLMIAIISPWYILVQQENPAFLHYFFVTQQISRFLSNGVFNNKTPFWFYLPVVFLGFLPWSVFLIQGIYQNFIQCIQNVKNHQTQLFLLLWIFIIFIFFSIPHSKIITYILPIFPALALIVGHYLSHALENVSQTGIRFGSLGFIIIGTGFAITLLAFAQFNWLDFTSDFLPSLVVIALIILSSVILSIFIRKKSVLSLISLYLCCSLFSLLALIQGTQYLNQNSAKSLVLNLKMFIQPQDEVVNYFKFYYDIPFYLGKRITIVANWESPTISKRDNWMRELSLGKTFQKTDNWLINEPTFWKRWNSDKRLFVFVNQNYFEQFKSHTDKYYLIGTSYDIYLISNKPDLHLAENPKFIREKSENRKNR